MCACVCVCACVRACVRACVCVCVCVWRKVLLLKYIGLPIPLFKSTFNFSQTVGEMVFVSFEVEKMRLFLVQSTVRWHWVVMWSCGAVSPFPCKTTDQSMVPISAGQLAEL